MTSHESVETLEINILEPTTPSKLLVIHAVVSRSVSNQKKVLHRGNAGCMSTWPEDPKCQHENSNCTSARLKAQNFRYYTG